MTEKILWRGLSWVQEVMRIRKETKAITYLEDGEIVGSDPGSLMWEGNRADAARYLGMGMVNFLWKERERKLAWEIKRAEMAAKLEAVGL